MDGMSSRGNSFSLEFLSLAPVAKAPSSRVMVLLLASVGNSLGTPRSSKVCQGLCLPPALHTPKPAPKPVFPLQRPSAPYLLFSALVSLGPFTVVGYLALKTSNIKKPLEQLKYGTKLPCLTRLPAFSYSVLHHQFCCVHLGKSCLCL